MRWITVVPIILAAGCATTPRSTTSPVVPATAEQVAACAYLDDLIGTSGLYGVFASRGADKARDQLLAQAAAIGATHVVWTQADAQYGGTSRQAKAYRCP